MADDPTPNPTPTPNSTLVPPRRTAPPWEGETFDPDRAWTLLQGKEQDIERQRNRAVRAEQERDDYKNRLEAAENSGERVTELEAELEQSRAENRGLIALHALNVAAAKYDGDVEALTDSASFERKLKAIDTTADDYAAQVEALVEETLEANPRLKRAQVAPPKSSGGDRPGGQQQSTGETPSVDEIREKRRQRRG